MKVFEDSDAIICQLCREPIWNFLCIDCLGENVEKWLPENLSGQFTGFHNEIKNHFHTFSSDNHEPCIDCRKTNETPICPYCYTKEVYHWIAPRNSAIAENFRKIFFFYPFEGIEHMKSETCPIEEYDNKRSGVGICDSCSEYSDILIQSDRGWCCEECIED